MYEPEEVVTDIAQIRAAQPVIQPAQQAKIIDRIDRHCRIWIERSPYMVMATRRADGGMDISPKGDPAGFVKVLDEKTLAIPDRPGNHRFDGFRNILETGDVSLLFLVPDRNEVVRVGGTARIVTDPELREAMAIKGRVPEFAVVVRVAEAFYHCGKAAIRSGLWRPGTWPGIEGLPTYAEAVFDHGNGIQDFEEIDARLRHNDANRLYDE